MKIDMRYRSKVLAIYDQIPGFLSQHEKRIYSTSKSSSNAIANSSKSNGYILIFLSSDGMTIFFTLSSD